MPDSPEARARKNIDQLLTDAGWVVQSREEVNLSAGRGIAIREFPMKPGFGEADYLLYVDGQALGVVEAKKEGSTLTGFEGQTAKYSEGLPDSLPAPKRPLPFGYQSTGIETRFTNLLEPEAASRNVFSFHRPEALADWLRDELTLPNSTVKARVRQAPPLAEQGLRPAQIKAIKNLELSLGLGKPRALIQMASGGGKTFTACNFIYRLIKYAGARRVLFLVDRSNLGRQTLKEFQNFRTPEEQRLFTELYNVQHLQSNKLDKVSKVCISTIQRLYSMLQGQEELDPALEEQAGFTLETLQREPAPVVYNPNIPIETFDVIVTDECHRSIYNLWRQVLEYFDASLIGLTATPSKQTLGFFNQNLVMEYNFEQAVADGVNVDFDLYTIRTLISEHGSTINAGYYVDFRDRETRRVRFTKADQDIPYDADELDRRVVAKDQIRTIIRTFRDRLFTEIFPGRTDVPKTLIFAKDDSHAEDIVQTVREEFGKGNDFAQKITYRTGAARVAAKKQREDGTEYEEVTWVNSGIKAEDLLSSFRNSYFPRIAVTVDMIATGTDVRPLEIVFFMRTVKSRSLFEQMKGRGARVVTETELKQVTPDASAKDRFVIVDAIGIDPNEMNETKPLERKKNVSLEKLMELVAFGNRETDILSSIASRLARLDRQLTQEDKEEIKKISGDQTISSIANKLVLALDPDEQLKAAQKATGKEEPPPEEIAKAAQALLTLAAQPIATNRKRAQEKCNLRRTEVAQGRFDLLKKHCPRLGEWSEKYLESVLHPNTRRRYASSRANLIAFFGEEAQLVHISTARIEEFKRARREEGIKAATLNRDLRFLAQILKQAERERYIGRSPFDLGKFFQNESKERRKPHILTWEEQEKLVAVAPPRIRVLTVLGVETGMRTGEMLGLKWSDIGFLNDILHVTQSKTRSGIRAVPVSPVCKAELLRWRNLVGPEHSEWVFPSFSNRRHRLQGGRKAWASALKKASLPFFPIYNLRHTFASRMTAAGVSPITIAQMLGHSSTQIVPRYAQVLDQNRLDAMKKLESLRQSAISDELGPPDNSEATGNGIRQ